MIVPYQHAARLSELGAETLSEMMCLAQEAVGAIQRAYSPAGYNLGMNLGHVAGAGIADHVHLHVVPRWEGDTNFMPIVAGTKVMPETLDVTYGKVRKEWKSETAPEEGRFPD